MVKKAELFKIDDTMDNTVKTIFANKFSINHQLILGDCIEKLKELKSNSIHLIITDPPYFLDGLDNNWDKENLENRKSKAGIVGGLPVGMKFDPKQGIKFQDFYHKVAQELMRVLIPGGYFLSFSQPRLFHRMAVAVEDAGFEIRDQYAWYYKQQAQMKAFSLLHFVEKMNISEKEKEYIRERLGNRKTPQLRPQFESIMLGQKPKEGTFIENWLKWEVGLVDTKQTLDGNSPSTIMEVNKPITEEKGDFNTHLTVKPVRLLEHLIKLFSKEGQIVLDPFLGSGSTMIASQNTNRICIGIEIQKDYLEISKQRLIKTGGNYVIGD